MLKIYISSSSGTPKRLTYIVIIAMFDELKLSNNYEENPKSDGGRSSTFYEHMLETLQDDYGYNRRVGGYWLHV